MSGRGALEVAAGAVCDAIHRHAETCRDEPENVSAVVQAGEVLCRAVLDYEAALRATSGWSNPIRHLGSLPLFKDRLGAVEGDGEIAPPDEEGDAAFTRVDVAVRYHLRIDNDDDLLAFASGRFGEEVFDVREAIRVLFEAESWDPERYPCGLVKVENVGVEISVDRVG